MKKYLTLFFCIFITSYLICQTEEVGKKDLKKIYKTMLGHFSSESQSKRDTNFFNIHLNMTPLWKEKNEYYLYVEQATSSALERPYRQRVYHLYIQDKNTIVSKVYEIKEPKKYINAYNKPSLLTMLTKDDLIDRQGCGIYLKKKGKLYVGSTPGKECLSTLRGATYATSEVEMYKDKMITLDRGWDATDKQVWGSTFGGYEFIKLKK
jgi:CpeT protein